MERRQGIFLEGGQLCWFERWGRGVHQRRPLERGEVIRKGPNMVGGWGEVLMGSLKLWEVVVEWANQRETFWAVSFTAIGTAKLDIISQMITLSSEVTISCPWQSLHIGSYRPVRVFAGSVTAMSYYFCIVGTRDNPLFELEFGTSKQGGDGVARFSAEARQMNPFIIHSSLDIVDEVQWLNPQMYVF